MPFSKVPSILAGHAAKAVKLWNVRYITTHRMLDLTDSAGPTKPIAESLQMSTRDNSAAAHQTDVEVHASGVDDHLQEFLMKEQASYGYSAEVQVYDDAKMISDNVMTAQMKKSSKRVTTLTY